MEGTTATGQATKKVGWEVEDLGIQCLMHDERRRDALKVLLGEYIA